MSGKQRTQRSDAAANVERVRAAALDLLGGGADPSMAEVAARAGVSRQTVYSHFPTRQALYDALVDGLVETTARTMGADLPPDPRAGLETWLERAWDLVDAYPALLNPALVAHRSATAGGDVMEEHEPLVGGLRRVLEEASTRGMLVADASPDWLIAAVIALGHAAGQEVAAHRMSADEAGEAFRSGALRLCLG